MRIANVTTVLRVVETHLQALSAEVRMHNGVIDGLKQAMQPMLIWIDTQRIMRRMREGKAWLVNGVWLPNVRYQLRKANALAQIEIAAMLLPHNLKLSAIGERATMR